MCMFHPYGKSKHLSYQQGHKGHFLLRLVSVPWELRSPSWHCFIHLQSSFWSMFSVAVCLWLLLRLSGPPAVCSSALPEHAMLKALPSSWFISDWYKWRSRPGYETEINPVCLKLDILHDRTGTWRSAITAFIHDSSNYDSSVHVWFSARADAVHVSTDGERIKLCCKVLL